MAVGYGHCNEVSRNRCEIHRGGGGDYCEEDFGGFRVLDSFLLLIWLSASIRLSLRVIHRHPRQSLELFLLSV